MSILEKVANVLDEVAATLERRPAPTAEQVVDPSKDEIAKIATEYKESTGDDLPAEVLAKIENDNGLKEMVTKLAAQKSRRPTPLGEATDAQHNQETPVTKQAALQAANDRFASRIIELGNRS